MEGSEVGFQVLQNYKDVNREETLAHGLVFFISFTYSL